MAPHFFKPWSLFNYKGMKNYITLLISLNFFWACSNEAIEETSQDILDDSRAGQTFTAELDLPAILFDYSNVELPDHFFGQVAQIDNTPNNNMISDAGATLGRVLFYYNILSANNSVSCASCHL